MTQSSDTQLNAIRELRDKLDPSSIERIALTKAITKYEHQENKILVHDTLVYTAPKNFYSMFLDALQAEEDHIKYINRIKYLIFGAYALFVLYMLMGY
jgi:hypothetical protein